MMMMMITTTTTIIITIIILSPVFILYRFLSYDHSVTYHQVVICHSVTGRMFCLLLYGVPHDHLERSGACSQHLHLPPWPPRRVVALCPVHSTACWVITSYPFLASPDTHDGGFARVCFVREMPGEVAVRKQAFPLSVMQCENNYSTSL